MVQLLLLPVRFDPADMSRCLQPPPSSSGPPPSSSASREYELVSLTHMCKHTSAQCDREQSADIYLHTHTQLCHCVTINDCTYLFLLTACVNTPVFFCFI